MSDGQSDYKAILGGVAFPLPGRIVPREEARSVPFAQGCWVMRPMTAADLGLPETPPYFWLGREAE